MGRVRVVTDSTADVAEEEARRLGIEVVPLTVQWSGESYRDQVDLSIDDFYRKLKEEKGAPRTSQPSAGQFEEVYRRLLGSADAVVSLHISERISGTVLSARTAAANVSPERIAVVDSRILSYPCGAMAVRIARLAEQGADLAECVAAADALVPRWRLFAAMDTLEYLRRGGRVSRFQAFAGNLISIKPIVQIVDGAIVPADRVRTRAASVKRMSELMLALGPLEEAAVLHGDDPAPAEQVAQLLGEAMPGVPIARGRTGAVIGTHTGPGVYGVCGLLAG